jgi:hypothetical protein
MKSKKITAMLSLLLVSAIFSAGCSDNGNSDSSGSSVSSDIVSSQDSVTTETSSTKSTGHEDTVTSTTTTTTTGNTVTSSVTSGNDDNDNSGSTDTETSTETVTETTVSDNIQSEDDSELLKKAQDLFDTACVTDWNFHVGCPYNLDFNTYIENNFGWQFYLVTDDNINSLDDVKADYFKVFSSSYGCDLEQIYMEENGRVYALNGERGSNIFYIRSEVTAVRQKTDTEIFFTVTNYYSGDDYNIDESYEETADFSAVIGDNGKWYAGEFTLPY